MFIFLFLMFIPCSFAIGLNEVHPRTSEWVEIFSQEFLNLSEWRIVDNSNQSDNITCYIIENCSLYTNASYFIIIGRNTNISSITNQTITYFYVDDQLIGNGLSDDGDFISFYNSTISVNMSYNWSFAGSWAWNATDWIECYNPTPGAENNCTNETEEQEFGNVFINGWNISSNNLSVNETVNITINVSNLDDRSYNISSYFIIEDVITLSEGEHDETVFCGITEILGNASLILYCNWTVPEDAMSSESIAWPKINFTYENITVERLGEERIIIINGVEDLGDHDLQVYNHSQTIRFGDFGFSVLRFYSGNEYYDKIRFVTYAYDPAWITRTLSGETLRTKPCEQDVAVQVNNVSRGDLLYVSVHFFAKDNCKNGYDEGIYTLKIKSCVFLDNEWKDLDSKKYNVTVSGNNNLFCEKTQNCPSTSSSSSSGRSSCSTAQKNYTQTTGPYTITYLPVSARPGEDFRISVSVKNTLSYPENFSAYSYIYMENDLVSLGWDSGWKGGWDANKKISLIDPNSTYIFDLRNMVKNNTEPGNYKINVRVLAGKNKSDLTNDFVVLEPEPDFYLNVTDENGVFHIRTDCEYCRIIMFTPDGVTEYEDDFDFTPNEYKTYQIALIKNSVIEDLKTVTAFQNENQPREEVGLPTGYAVKGGEDIFEGISSFFTGLIDAITDFFS